MHHDHNFHWQMPDGESLFDFLARHAEEQARMGPRFAAFSVQERTPVSSAGLLLCLAAFLARHPHCAPRRLPPIPIDCLETWGQWQTFFAWACHEGCMTEEEAQRLRYALSWVSALDFGGLRQGIPTSRAARWPAGAAAPSPRRPPGTRRRPIEAGYGILWALYLLM